MAIKEIISKKESIIREELKSIMDDEEKKKAFAHKYGFSIEETDELCQDMRVFSKLIERQSANSYWDGYATVMQALEERIDELSELIDKKIESHIIIENIDKIELDEITPDLMEKLIEVGYDGKTGSLLLQQYFQMYVQIQENDKKNQENKSAITSLESQVEENRRLLNALTTRDGLLQEMIGIQNGYITNIMQRMTEITTNSSNINSKLTVRSFGEKLKRFFLRTKEEERKILEESGREMSEQNGYALYECNQVELLRMPTSVNEILREDHMYGYDKKSSIYDEIVSPIESDKNLLEMIKKYAKLKAANKLSVGDMYDSIIFNSKKLSEDEVFSYDEKFFSFIVLPSVKRLEDKVKTGRYIRQEKSFKHLCDEKYFRELFSYESAEEIIAKGRNIESKNQEIFEKVNEIFMKHGNTENRIELYKDYLRRNNINLSTEELKDWLNYRIVMEEFQNPRLMGFHPYMIEPRIDDEKMKLYINAGSDTYEVARVFADTCERHMGVPPTYKVVVGNMPDEIDRVDKLCIYIENEEQAALYMNILRDIKERRDDITFEQPPLIAGTIDNWIGVGSDIPGASSYNYEMSNHLINSFNEYFSNMSEQQIMEQLSTNPELLDKIRSTISEKCLQTARSPQKICITDRDEHWLKQSYIERSENVNPESEQQETIRETRPIEEIISEEISPETISEELMKMLYENGYDGKSGHPVIQSYYQLYCKKQEMVQEAEGDSKKIKSLKGKLDVQTDEKSVLDTRRGMLENIINNQKRTAFDARRLLESSSRQINSLQEGLRQKGLFFALREFFSRRDNLLPENRNRFYRYKY